MNKSDDLVRRNHLKDPNMFQMQSYAWSRKKKKPLQI